MTKYDFQQITVQGDTGGTVASGINDEGQITGWSVPGGYNIYPHSFVDTGGAMTAVTATSTEGGLFVASQAAASGINDKGQVSGTDGDAFVGHRGFLWSPDGSVQVVTTANDHGASTTFAYAYGVNDLGQVVGSNYAGNIGGPHNAFLWQNGGMSFLQYPGANVTDARGISDNDIIVGSYGSSIFDFGNAFIDRHGHMQTIDVPGAVSAEADAISPDGKTIVGTYLDAAGHDHGWIDGPGRIQTFDIPGATDTGVLGVNDFGQIVGSYMTAADIVPGYTPVQHGFVATPQSDNLGGDEQHELPETVRQVTGLARGSLFYDPSQPFISLHNQ